MIFRTEYAHEETIARFGSDPRSFGILSKALSADDEGNVAALHAVGVEWKHNAGISEMAEVEGTEQTWEADLILLAMGFLGPEVYQAEALGVALDPRSNYQAEHGDFKTDVSGVFAAGDCRRGQSLVVWAINEGRGAARAIDQYLVGTSSLPAPGITMDAASG